MLLFSTTVLPSPGLGLGLFALVDIPNGEKYWERDERFDKVIPIKEFESYKEIARKYIEYYGFQETENNWYLCSDNARFTNHSNTPNTTHYHDEKGTLIYCTTTKDIKAGEEILCDYKELCLTCKEGLPWEK